MRGYPVDQRIGGAHVVRVFDQVISFGGYPEAMRTDNEPELTSRAFIAWTQRHGIDHLVIEQGKSMQDDYFEGFNGEFRDECLNELWLTSLEKARQVIVDWRCDYNELRPHGNFGRIPCTARCQSPSTTRQQHSNPQPRALWGQVR